MSEELSEGTIPEGTEAPEGQISEGQVDGGEANAEGATTPAPQAKEDSWKDKRIAKLAAQKRELEAKLAATEKSITQPQADESRAQAIAREKLEFESFNQRCAEARSAGDAKYPDFGERIAALTSIRDKDDPEEAKAYDMLVRVALDTGEGPKVLHMLGGDLDYARRVLEMTPHKMGIELAKLAASEAKKVSSAPKPITVVGGKGTTHSPIDPTDASRADSLSTQAWMERRQQQIRDRYKARRG